MKTKEELNAIKEEIETLNNKLAELNEEELKQVAGGFDPFEKLGGFSQGNDPFSPDLGKSADKPFIIDSVTDLEKLANIVGE